MLRFLLFFSFIHILGILSYGNAHIAAVIIMAGCIFIYKYKIFRFEEFSVFFIALYRDFMMFFVEIFVFRHFFAGLTEAVHVKYHK